MNTEQERADFEAWARANGYQQDELDRCRIGIVGPEYFNLNTENAFKAYQAGRAALQSQDREDVPFRQQLKDEIESLRQDNASLLHLLAQIREACGDNGKRMQDELVEYIRDERQGYISHIALLKGSLRQARAELDDLTKLNKGMK